PGLPLFVQHISYSPNRHHSHLFGDLTELHRATVTGPPPLHQETKNRVSAAHLLLSFRHFLRRSQNVSHRHRVELFQPLTAISVGGTCRIPHFRFQAFRWPVVEQVVHVTDVVG